MTPSPALHGNELWRRRIEMGAEGKLEERVLVVCKSEVASD